MASELEEWCDRVGGTFVGQDDVGSCNLRGHTRSDGPPGSISVNVSESFVAMSGVYMEGIQAVQKTTYDTLESDGKTLEVVEDGEVKEEIYSVQTR